MPESGRLDPPVTLAEIRVERKPFPIYLRLVRLHTAFGVKFIIEVTSNSNKSSNFVTRYDDEEKARRDYKEMIRNYSAYPRFG